MKARSHSRRQFIRTSALAAASFPFVSSLTRSALAAEEPRKLGFCVVGLGGLSNGQIGPALLKTKFGKITAVVTGHPEKADRWKTSSGNPNLAVYSYDTMNKMADNPAIDVVYVVTPNALHAEHTIKSLQAGKHVYCEKPMETSVEKCQQMIDAAKKANRMLGVAYRCQFDPNHLYCKQLVDQKTYGAIKTLDAGFGRGAPRPGEWRLDKALAGGGPLMDVGIYALQTSRFIGGAEPIEVTGKEPPKTMPDRFTQIEESMEWQAKFPNNYTANCTCSYAGGAGRFKFTAEKGTFGLDPAYGYTGCRGTESDGTNTKPIAAVQGFDEFAAEMDDFAQCILNKKASKVSGEEGLRDVKIMLAIYESARTGKAVKL